MPTIGVNRLKGQRDTCTEWCRVVRFVAREKHVAYGMFQAGCRPAQVQDVGVRPCTIARAAGGGKQCLQRWMIFT